MQVKPPEYEIYALRYATRAGATISSAATRTTGPCRWTTTPLVVGPATTCVVDTGFTAEMAKEWRRTFLRCPAQSLKLLGDVVLTHMHYDHVGNFDKFPNARFHLQEGEIAYATGRYMRYGQLGHSYHVEDVVGMVRLNFKGRVEMCNGSVEIAPGIVLHPAPGHSAGLQIARVHTRRGWVVLASDATHFYENLATNRPFPTALHVGQMLDAYRIVEKLAPSPRHIVPGHDPYVMREYPPPRADLEGIAVRLDLEPSAPAPAFDGSA